MKDARISNLNQDKDHQLISAQKAVAVSTWILVSAAVNEEEDSCKAGTSGGGELLDKIIPRIAFGRRQQRPLVEATKLQQQQLPKQLKKRQQQQQQLLAS